jgi:hypothetical protein
VFNFVNYGNDPTDVEGALNAALKTLSSPSGDESSHKLVILGYGIHPALLIAKRNKQQLEYGGI